MSNLKTFDFEGHDLRTEVIGGSHWWLAKDVCFCLEIGNPSQALKRLDADEVTLISNERNHRPTNYVSEFGLYRLILSSRKKSAERFKRWLAHDVLPTLRKTGRYEMPGLDRSGSDRGLVSGSVLLPGPVADVNAAAGLVKECRVIHGRPAAAALWDRLELPDVSALGVNKAAGSSLDDGPGCLVHLLHYTLAPIQGVRQTVGSVLAKMLDFGDEVTPLCDLGLAILPDKSPEIVAVAHDSPFLDGVYELTQWKGGGWRLGLLNLPQVSSSANTVKFGKTRKRAVLIPRAVIAARGVL